MFLISKLILSWISWGSKHDSSLFIPDAHLHLTRYNVFAWFLIFHSFHPDIARSLLIFHFKNWFYVLLSLVRYCSRLTSTVIYIHISHNATTSDVQHMKSLCVERRSWHRQTTTRNIENVWDKSNYKWKNHTWLVRKVFRYNSSSSEFDDQWSDRDLCMDSSCVS